MQHLKKFNLFFLSVLLIFSILNAAQVEGLIYGPDFELLENAVVFVNSTPDQAHVASDGSYSFELPPGNYLIKVKYVQLDSLVFSDSINIIILNEEGKFTIDFILLPEFGDEELFENPPELETPSLEEETSSELFYVFGALIILLLIALTYSHFKKIKKQSKISPPTTSVKKYNEALPEDLKELLEIIKNNGGRITQKELRSLIPLSEAKVSLMVADLENRKLLRKIKRGRGNIIVLNSIPSKKN